MQYSRLRFGRTTIENRFKVLKAAVARAFEDTDLDPEQLIEEYVKLKHSPETCHPTSLHISIQTKQRRRTELEVQIPAGAPRPLFEQSCRHFGTCF